jgi:integrase
MAKQTLNKLTDREVKAAKPKAGKSTGTLNDGGGLRLRVQANGAKSYEYRFQIDGRVRDMFIGSADHISLADAREAATEARKLVKAKIDPIEQAKTQREADKAATLKAEGGPTFGEASKALLAQRKASWSDSNAKTWAQSLRDYCASITDMPCEQIVADDLFPIFDPIWYSRNELASRLRHRVERVLSFARTADGKNQYFSRDWVNPARWPDNLKNRYGNAAKREVKGHPHLPPEAVPAFVARLREKDTNAALLLEFIALTAVRSSEARLAEWGEFDIEKALWVVPVARMKTRRKNPKPHTVPLSPRAIQILDEMRLRSGRSPYVFAGMKPKEPVGHATMRWLMTAMDASASPHGFRKSFRTWAREAGIKDDTAEACLAHLDPNRVQGDYMKSDLMTERRRALEAWADFIGSQPVANVLPLRRA